MGPFTNILCWLLGKTSEAKPITYLAGPKTFSIDVVGESHYQAALESICGGRTDQGYEKIVEAVLVHEDDNPYDNKAIRVDIQGKTVGHLSRENARQFRNRLEKAGYKGITATCSAIVVGGWDRGNGDTGHFGVRLDLPTGHEIVEDSKDISNAASNHKRNSGLERYPTRQGHLISTDAAFDAWTSANMQAMLRALQTPTNPVDRHFLFLGIVQQAYRKRNDPEMKSLFLKHARQHVDEFSGLADSLKREFDGKLPRVPTFQYLASVLMEDGQYDEAIDICRSALSFGLDDGTKSGFAGRIERIQRTRRRAAAQAA